MDERRFDLSNHWRSMGRSGRLESGPFDMTTVADGVLPCCVSQISRSFGRQFSKSVCEGAARWSILYDHGFGSYVLQMVIPGTYNGI
jgi:hypothetical protein